MVHAELNKNRVTITPIQDLIGPYGKSIKKDINELAALETKEIIIDMQFVNVMDTSSIGMLISALNKVNFYNGILHLTNLNDDLISVFQFIDMHDFFPEISYKNLNQMATENKDTIFEK